MKDMALQGTDKFAGAEKDSKETIDILPDILGKEGYVHGVMFDLIKRIIRFKNQSRERDLIKMALWCYLLWMYLFPKKSGVWSDGRDTEETLKRYEARLGTSLSELIKPHLGEPAILNSGNGKFWVKCGHPRCDIESPRMSTPWNAVLAWNDRIENLYKMAAEW